MSQKREKKRETGHDRFVGRCREGKEKKSLIQHTPFFLQSGFLTSVSASTEKMEMFWLFFCKLNTDMTRHVAKSSFPEKIFFLPGLHKRTGA